MSDTPLNSYRTLPDDSGRFGLHGGRFVAETLMPLILEVETAYRETQADPSFASELAYFHKHYIGRPSPLYFAERLTEAYGGAKLYLKRDELNHTGAHKINNVIGQALLAKRMGKTKIIAETGAGQHGVATATACALFNMECEVGNRMILEFEAEMDGKYINGVDIIDFNDEGLITQFKVMVRPLQAVNMLWQQMGAQLEKASA